MNPEIKAQWIAALRSGDYQQGKYGLNNNNMYCCLGVLCDLAAKQGVVTQSLPYGGPTGTVYYGTPSSGAYLPQDVQDWSGVTSRTGELAHRVIRTIDRDRDRVVHTLAQANDYGLTFEQIAEIIEEQF